MLIPESPGSTTSSWISAFGDGCLIIHSSEIFAEGAAQNVTSANWIFKHQYIENKGLGLLSIISSFGIRDQSAGRGVAGEG
jgi:hypothetical protein